MPFAMQLIAWFNARLIALNGAFHMAHISANDLKTKGVSAIEAVLAEHSEAMVSVRGKDRFVVMDVAQYHYLRECELAAALAETRADMAAGRFTKESVDDHLAWLDQACSN